MLSKYVLIFLLNLEYAMVSSTAVLRLEMPKISVFSLNSPVTSFTTRILDPLLQETTFALAVSTPEFL